VRKPSQFFPPKVKPEQDRVEHDDGSSHRPADNRGYSTIREFAHLAAVAGELNQRHNGKWQLEAQDHLLQDEERGDMAFAHNSDHQRSRDDRGGTA